MAVSAHIVVVEDEGTQRQLLATYLDHHGFRVTMLEHGTDLRALLERQAPTLPNLVVLDLRLTGEDSVELARHVRAHWPQIGIIMLSDTDDAAQRAVGLEAGADDYLPRPFEPRELLARVRSVLRRVRPAGQPVASRVRIGRRVLDLDMHLLLADPGEHTAERLSDPEFAVLRAFVANPHRPLEPQFIATLLGASGDRTAVATMIEALRRKIEYDPKHPRTLRGVRGVGYMFVPESN